MVFATRILRRTGRSNHDQPRTRCYGDSNRLWVFVCRVYIYLYDSMIFFLTRLLDLHSTYLNVTKWGTSVEGIPFNRGLLESLTYGQFVVLNLTLSMLAYFVLKRFKLGRPAVRIFTLVNLLVVIQNYILYMVV